MVIIILTNNQHKQAFEELFEACNQYGHYPTWIFFRCRHDHIKIEFKDIVRVYHQFKKKYNWFPSWVEKQKEDFKDILLLPIKQEPKPEPTKIQNNIFFAQAFHTDYELKKFFLQKRKETFAKPKEYKKVYQQYFEYRSKPK